MAFTIQAKNVVEGLVLDFEGTAAEVLLIERHSPFGGEDCIIAQTIKTRQIMEIPIIEDQVFDILG